MTFLKSFLKQHANSSLILLFFVSAVGLGLYLPNRQTREVNRLTLIDRQVILEKEADKLIKQLEASYSEENRLAAQAVVDELKIGDSKNAFQARIDAVRQRVSINQAAEFAVKHLEDNQTDEHLVSAQKAVDQVLDANLRQVFQNRINAVSAAIEQRKKIAEANRVSQEVTQQETFIIIEPEVVTPTPTPAPTPTPTPAPTPTPEPDPVPEPTSPPVDSGSSSGDTGSSGD